MSDPSFRPLNLGNTSDDDPEVIDSLVQTVSEPPKPQVEPIVTPALPLPVKPNRLFSVRQTVDPSWDRPTLILPEDTRRKFLRINVTSPTDVADDGVVIIDHVGASTGRPVVMHGADIELPGYTGAVFAIATGSAAVYVDCWSVTE